MGHGDQRETFSLSSVRFAGRADGQGQTQRSAQGTDFWAERRREARVGAPPAGPWDALRAESAPRSVVLQQGFCRDGKAVSLFEVSGQLLVGV